MNSKSVLYDPNSREPFGILKGIYISETPRSILLKLIDKQSFWLPKSFIIPDYLSDSSLAQDFKVDNKVLRRLSKLL